MCNMKSIVVEGTDVTIIVFLKDLFLILQLTAPTDIKLVLNNHTVYCTMNQCTCYSCSLYSPTQITIIIFVGS